MEKKEYIAPTLTVVTFKVEQGFALSGGSGPQNAFLGLFEANMAEDYNSQGQQNWQESGSFGSDW